MSCICALPRLLHPPAQALTLGQSARRLARGGWQANHLSCLHIRLLSQFIPRRRRSKISALGQKSLYASFDRSPKSHQRHLALCRHFAQFRMISLNSIERICLGIASTSMLRRPTMSASMMGRSKPLYFTRSAYQIAVTPTRKTASATSHSDTPNSAIIRSPRLLRHVLGIRS